MTFREIYDIAVPHKKRKEERYNQWVVYVVRPLSVLCTLPFINRQVKPTTITAWSIICAIVGSLVLACSSTIVCKIIGWGGFFAWAILDGVDGNLARCKNQCSALGDLWDTMGGYTAMILIYYVAGIVAYFDNNILFIFNKYVYLILGGATAIFAIFPRLILHKKKSSQVASDKVEELIDTSNFGSIKRFAGNITSPSGIMQVIFLIAIVTHTVNIFISFYFIINFFIMLVTLRMLLSD